ncbi:type IA DNA topoisomerase [Pseudolactococcus yaeyamensis]
MTIIILAEKPRQALAYAGAFSHHQKCDGYYQVRDPDLFDGEDVCITFGMGHLIELYRPQDYNKVLKSWRMAYLPIFPLTYQFKVAKDKRKQYAIVKQLLKSSNHSVIGTDFDREGENIAWSIMTQAGLKPTDGRRYERLVINSLEEESIREGFSNLKGVLKYYPRYKEAQTRQIADWLVGINLTRLFTNQFQTKGYEGVFSVGRVQTPTLAMVCQREFEIDRFVPKSQWSPVLETDLGFKAFLNPKAFFESQNDLIKFLNQNHIDPEKNESVVEAVTHGQREMFSPQLFSLRTLQAEANKRFKMSGKETIEAAQSLYEKELITYPRTASNHITDKEFAYLKENLTTYATYLDLSAPLDQLEPRERYVDNSKAEGESHLAIIPTRQIPKAVLVSREAQIYDLILRTTVAMFAHNYICDETVAVLSLQALSFKAKGKVLVDRGFKDILSKDLNKLPFLPPLKIGQKLSCDVVLREGETSPPKHYTEGTLILAMAAAGADSEQMATKDACGLATEATRATIIERLKETDYIKVVKNNIAVTDKGNLLYQAIKNFPLLSTPEMTAKWEAALDKIGSSQYDPDMLQKAQDGFLTHCKRFVSDTIHKAPEIFEAVPKHTGASHVESISCPKCRCDLMMRPLSYNCSSDQCDFKLWKKKSGKTLPDSAIKILLAGGTTTVIEGFKSKAGKKFAASLKLNSDFQVVFDDFR